MQIKVADQLFQLKKDSSLSTQCFEYIDLYMKESELLFSHLIVDGVEVYENYEKYLDEHSNDIHDIEACMSTVDELNSNILKSSHEYVRNAISALNPLAEQFTGSPSSEAWKQYVQLLEGIDWLTKMMDTAGSSGGLINEKPNFDKIAQQLQEQLKSLEGAMNNQDNGLIADIIRYEIFDIFEDLLALLTSLMNNEVVLNDIN